MVIHDGQALGYAKRPSLLERRMRIVHRSFMIPHCRYVSAQFINHSAPGMLRLVFRASRHLSTSKTMQIVVVGGYHFISSLSTTINRLLCAHP